MYRAKILWGFLKPHTLCVQNFIQICECHLQIFDELIWNDPIIEIWELLPGNQKFGK